MGTLLLSQGVSLWPAYVPDAIQCKRCQKGEHNCRHCCGKDTEQHQCLPDHSQVSSPIIFSVKRNHMLLEHWCDDDFKESPEEMAELVWYIATGQAYMNIKEKGKK